MRIELLPMEFTVYRLSDYRGVDFAAPYTFAATTTEEKSLVCPSERAPKGVEKAEGGFCCLKVLGPLDFSLVGILAGVAGCLAAEAIPLFAISTYDTDYVLFKAARLESALGALARAGHEIVKTGLSHRGEL